MSAGTVVHGIAIVGMAGRFPGGARCRHPLGATSARASSPCAGSASQSGRPRARTRLDPGFVDAGASMDGIEAFDAAFFGMSRREAELTDPQHRILLETAWAAIEHAGYHPGMAPGASASSAASPRTSTTHLNLLANPSLLSKAGYYPILLASAREYAITRAAYKLGLTGPAITVITACSTSAVATHLAVQSLLAGDCDLALAGAAHLYPVGSVGYATRRTGSSRLTATCAPSMPTRAAP